MLAKYTTITAKGLQKDTDTESVSGILYLQAEPQMICLASPLSDLTLASPEGATAIEPESQLGEKKVVTPKACRPTTTARFHQHAGPLTATSFQNRFPLLAHKPTCLLSLSQQQKMYGYVVLLLILVNL